MPSTNACSLTSRFTPRSASRPRQLHISFGRYRAAVRAPGTYRSGQDEVVRSDVGSVDSAQCQHGIANLDLYVLAALPNRDARLETVRVNVAKVPDVDHVAVAEIHDGIAVTEDEPVAAFATGEGVRLPSLPSSQS